jgi:hypothetical protein
MNCKIRRLNEKYRAETQNVLTDEQNIPCRFVKLFGFWSSPSSSFLKTRKLSVLETGSVFVLR